MSEIKYVSFVIVIVGPDCNGTGTTVETSQYWSADAAQKPDYIANAIVSYSNKHGTTIDRVIVREINS